MQIIETKYGKVAKIDGIEVEVFENGMELAYGWEFNYDPDATGFEIVEIDLLDMQSEGEEFEHNGNTYRRYTGQDGDFFVNVDGEYTVYVLYENGQAENAYETEEEAQKIIDQYTEKYTIGWTCDGATIVQKIEVNKYEIIDNGFLHPLTGSYCWSLQQCFQGWSNFPMGGYNDHWEKIKEAIENFMIEITRDYEKMYKENFNNGNKNINRVI